MYLKGCLKLSDLSCTFENDQYQSEFENDQYQSEFYAYRIVKGFLVQEDGKYVTQQDGKKIRFTL